MIVLEVLISLGVLVLCCGCYYAGVGVTSEKHEAQRKADAAAKKEPTP